MEGVTALLARLLYGTGMRLMEGMRLRIKDVDFVRLVIIVRDAKGGSNEGIVQHWQKLIGAQNVLRLEDENAAGECVAAQFGICEGTTDADGIAKDLTDIHGIGAGTHALIRAVTGSISTTGRGEALTRMPEGSLAVGSSPVEVERL
jgi:hypothetical protein